MGGFGMKLGSPSTITDQRALAQPDVLQWWMKVLPLSCILLGFGASEQSGLQGIFTK